MIAPAVWFMELIAVLSPRCTEFIEKTPTEFSIQWLSIDGGVSVPV
jgi:hypothetical protein